MYQTQFNKQHLKIQAGRYSEKELYNILYKKGIEANGIDWITVVLNLGKVIALLLERRRWNDIAEKKPYIGSSILARIHKHNYVGRYFYDLVEKESLFVQVDNHDPNKTLIHRLTDESDFEWKYV